MKKNISLLATIAVLALSLPVTANTATQVYDLKTDWSDTQNPNGTWTYLLGETGSLLTSDPFPWASWAAQGGLAAIARATEAVVYPYSGNLEPGDIYVVPSDPTDGSGGVTVRWTAPANGIIDVSGNSWLCATWWKLKINGNVLSSGDTSQTVNTRDLPYQFSSGSGGATALQSIAVQAGDQVELYLETWFRNADDAPVGLNFTITLTPDSFDPVTAIGDLAIAVFEMNLQNGIENSLDSKLDAAVAALIDVNVNNDGAACNSLTAFINAVEAQRGQKITSAQADQLIATAQQIQAMLNCGN